MIATTASTSSTSSSSTYVILPTSLSTSSSAANIRNQTQALANLAFRVRVFECSSADHGQQQQQYPTAHSGGLPLDGRQAESDLVPLVQGHEPIVDQIVEWQEQILPPIPLTSATGPFLHTHSHSQLLSHLTSASRHAATRLARSSAIDMHVYLSIPSPSSSSARNNSRAAYTLARMRLSPASGALSVSPPLGILARLAIDSSTTAATSARALAWIYVVELHAAPLPQAQVLETLRLGLASLKQSHLLSPLPPTRLLHPPPPDLRHTNRVYVNTTLSSFTLRITETKLPLYASHVSVAWRIELGGGGWQVADEAQVLAGTSHRVRVEAPSLWAYVWVAVWRWLWWVVMGGAIGGTKDGQVRKVALGVPVDVVLVQRAAQADPSARPLLHLTIYSDPLTTTPARRPASSSSASRSSMRGPNRYLLGTCTIPLPLTPAGAVTASAKRSYAIHRPVLPPSVLMPESLFGTPALPADSKWPTVVAGHVEVAASVAVQAARAGGATMGMGSGAGILGVLGSPGGAGGVNAESVQAAVVRARSRLAAIKAAQAGTAAGGTAGS